MIKSVYTTKLGETIGFYLEVNSAECPHNVQGNLETLKFLIETNNDSAAVTMLKDLFQVPESIFYNPIEVINFLVNQSNTLESLNELAVEQGLTPLQLVDDFKEKEYSYAQMILGIFKILLSKQDSLNTLTVGQNWYRINILGKKEVNWLRCQNMEVCELIDSSHWKHWKKVDGLFANKPNIMVEFVDILHFALAEVLSIFEGYADVLAEKTQDAYLESKGKDISKTIFVKGIETLSKEDAELLILIKNLELFSEKALSYSRKKDLYLCSNGTIGTSLDELESIAIELLVDLFVLMDYFDKMIEEDFSIDEVFKLYLGKNTLNEFRQDNGYKEGTYIKEWQLSLDTKPVEDNVVMQETLTTITTQALIKDPRLIYTELNKSYKLAEETLEELKEKEEN